jgi:hypothetical protein
MLAAFVGLEHGGVKAPASESGRYDSLRKLSLTCYGTMMWLSWRLSSWACGNWLRKNSM